MGVSTVPRQESSNVWGVATCFDQCDMIVRSGHCLSLQILIMGRMILPTHGSHRHCDCPASLGLIKKNTISVELSDKTLAVLATFCILIGLACKLLLL